jgi:hypothetical protein
MIECCPGSKHAANCSLPAKKDADGVWNDIRFCVNWSSLNTATIFDTYTMPTPDELIDNLGRSKFFSKIDLRAAFHQVLVHEESRPKTAFHWTPGPREGKETPPPGLYVYKRMPYGLCNCPAWFQRIMDTTLANLQHCAAAYLDDIIVWSDTFEDHLRHIDQVLQALCKVGLLAHPAKCVFFAETVEFLGFEITPTGKRAHEAKIQGRIARANTGPTSRVIIAPTAKEKAMDSPT